MDVHFYMDGRGRQPVCDWIHQMRQKEPETYRRAVIMLSYLRENGHEIQSGTIIRSDIKKLKKSDDIWQLRINDDRLLYFYYANDTIVFTNQFRKKKNSTPSREITRAERRKKDWTPPRTK